MVKIKRFTSERSLTTKPTSPLVNPSEFTKDLRAKADLGKLITQTADAFIKVRNVNDKTEQKIALNQGLLEIEKASLTDPDIKNVQPNSDTLISDLLNSTSQNIGDEQTRKEYMLFATSQANDTRRRIATTNNSRLLKKQKDDFEVNLTFDTKAINELQNQGQYDDASRKAQEVVANIEEMERTFIIFPEVATARLKTFTEAITAEGQATYEIEHMTTANDMATVSDRLENNVYGLDKKLLSEKKTEFNKIKKALIDDAEDLLKAQYTDNLGKILDNKELDYNQRVNTLREAIKKGAAKQDGGVDTVLGAKVLTQVIEQKKTITDQRANAIKIKEAPALALIKNSYQMLGLDDNKTTSTALADEFQVRTERANDAKKEQVETHIELIVDFLAQGFISPEEAGKEIGKASELLQRRHTEEAKGLFLEKQNANTEYKKFLGWTTSSLVRPEFLENAQDTKDQIRMQIYNDFMDKLDVSDSSQKVKDTVKAFKDVYQAVFIPSVVNVPSGSPNGVGSATKPIETTNDSKSTAEAETTIKPKKTQIHTKIFEKNGVRKRVVFDGDVPIKEEVLK